MYKKSNKRTNVPNMLDILSNETLLDSELTDLEAFKAGIETAKLIEEIGTGLSREDMVKGKWLCDVGLILNKMYIIEDNSRKAVFVDGATSYNSGDSYMVAALQDQNVPVGYNEIKALLLERISDVSSTMHDIMIVENHVRMAPICIADMTTTDIITIAVNLSSGTPDIDGIADMLTWTNFCVKLPRARENSKRRHLAIKAMVDIQADVTCANTRLCKLVVETAKDARTEYFNRLPNYVQAAITAVDTFISVKMTRLSRCLVIASVGYYTKYTPNNKAADMLKARFGKIEHDISIQGPSDDVIKEGLDLIYKLNELMKYEYEYHMHDIIATYIIGDKPKEENTINNLEAKTTTDTLAADEITTSSISGLPTKEILSDEE